MKKIVIFDLDKTLVTCNLPENILKECRKTLPGKRGLIHALKNYLYELSPGRLKRLFEYFELDWLPYNLVEELCIKQFNVHINTEVMSVLMGYKKKGYGIYIVTAGPQRVIEPIGHQLEAKIIGSLTFAGVITTDIQDKKEKIYKRLVKERFEIEAIYSDRECDFSSLAKKNYLVNGEEICEV